MRKLIFLAPLLLGTMSLTPAIAQERGISSSAASMQSENEVTVKRRVAIGRFTNETRYGQTLLRDSDIDPLGKQAADIMAAYLVQTGPLWFLSGPTFQKF